MTGAAFDQGGVASPTPEELRAGVAALAPWFHNIDLCGVKTAPGHFLGDYPRIKWRHLDRVLPRDLAGRTVLDIGCNAGYFSLAMKKRGADRVVAIDTDERHLAQARFAAHVLDLALELKQMSVYDVERLGERFDIVLFTGVMYHLRHPLLALDLINAHVVGDLLVFQSLTRGEPEARAADDYEFWDDAPFEDPGFPRLHFIEKRFAGDPTNWWIPNEACVGAMLRSAGFDIVARPESETYLCRRRAVGNEATS